MSTSQLTFSTCRGRKNILYSPHVSALILRGHVLIPALLAKVVCVATSSAIDWCIQTLIMYVGGTSGRLWLRLDSFPSHASSSELCSWAVERKHAWLDCHIMPTKTGRGLDCSQQARTSFCFSPIPLLVEEIRPVLWTLPGCFWKSKQSLSHFKKSKFGVFHVSGRASLSHLQNCLDFM